MLIAAARFNSDFYVVVATVMPVLYLSLMLQAATFRQWWRVWVKAVAMAGGIFRGPERWLNIRVGLPLCAITCVTQVSFVVGEGVAIQVLSSRHAYPVEHSFALFGVLALVGVVGASALLYVFYPEEASDVSE